MRFRQFTQRYHKWKEKTDSTHVDRKRAWHIEESAFQKINNFFNKNFLNQTEAILAGLLKVYFNIFLNTPLIEHHRIVRDQRQP